MGECEVIITVETSNSTYVIDDVKMTVVRETHTGHEMRRDSEPIAMDWFSVPPLGGSLQMQLAIREDGAKTFRLTSEVVSVKHDDN